MNRSVVLVSLSLAVSLFIYLFYRTERTLVNEMAIRLITLDEYRSLKAAIVHFLPLHDIIIYSLPEGLWVFCITIASLPYYVNIGTRRFWCVFVPLIFSVSLELLQLMGITNGRFDLIDIAAVIIFWVAGILTAEQVRPQINLFHRPDFKTVMCVTSYCIVYLAHVFK
ncbi:hypothetical protein [Mucilaginibacter aquatilis]|uniref:Uncharacterized protein n=1 Tax=Mucilaginibacter aquatilis TaxID=1517760 RepID=A0A6I4IB13_9SPHI|nr:hypothetical protein [Mucilaginibacter aquatilis]MVN91118.1 hypothetical protein [Mucilaginibacter aquatilis]